MAQTKTYPYLLYALAALCVVLLAPYAGCHIMTSKPHTESEILVEESGGATQGGTTSDDPRSAAEANEQVSASSSTDKIEDIEKALNLE